MSTCTTPICDPVTVGVIDDDATSARSRRTYWRHVGEVFGLPFTTAQLDEAAQLDDRQVVERFLPFLGDAERSEVLWALGAYLQTG